ncbi:hypothetical protein [Fodinicola feengrottensis]|uniref:Uncharacterized protein n=1 Tax=Fodinicola feengrottensis TaxID=435914 RepID=A0ABP4RQB7_9ACTN|nr:hypothetical protein [Fodinicola feengrottensis]
MLLRALIDRDGEVVGVSADFDETPQAYDPPHRPGDRISTLRIPDPAGDVPLLELHRRLSYDRTTGQLRLASCQEAVCAS